jgi:hypothetical protein
MSIYTTSPAAITCPNPGMTSRIVLADAMEAPIALMLPTSRILVKDQRYVGEADSTRLKRLPVALAPYRSRGR